MRSLTLAGRATLAVALIVGAYALALGVGCGLLLLAVVGWRRGDARLVVVGVLGAGAVVWSAMPRRGAPSPLGLRLDSTSQPRLFEQVRQVATDVGQPMPQRIYLLADASASITQRGGGPEVGGGRVMQLGLLLLQTLSVSEVRAVLAHEFGHFQQGSIPLGRWIWRTRAAIGRGVVDASQRGSVLRHPFLWYGKLFLRITHAVARGQEVAADVLAARSEGGEALAAGLTKARDAAVAMGAYWNNELLPVLRAGYQPPVAEGFARFLRSPRVAAAVGRSARGEPDTPRSDPYDPHPPLPERLAAIQARSRQARREEPLPAIELLADVPTLERRLLASMMDADEVERLTRVTWEAVGQTVLVPDWRALVRNCALALRGRTVEALPETRGELDQIARSLPPLPAGGEDPERRRLCAAWVLGAAVALVLVERGWSVLDLPGAPILLVAPPRAVDPAEADPSAGALNLSELIGRILEGTLVRGEWERRCRQLGIGGQRLDLQAAAVAAG